MERLSSKAGVKRVPGVADLDTSAASRGAVCQICQRRLVDTWRAGGQLCCECGLSQELFRPETRWIDAGSDADPAPSITRPAPSRNDVRKRSARVAMFRLGLKALAAVAPAAAEERGARMFFTPRRAARWTPPAIANVAATSFHLLLEEQEIACWSWGRGPTVILIHGWEGHAGQLIHFVPPLISAGFRVVTFDMPAHGGSTGRQLTVFDMSRVIRSVAQVFSPTRAVIAHSLGATASILALSEGLEVGRVVLLAPAAEPRHFARVLAARLGLSKTGADGMLKRIENRLGMRFEEVSTLRLVPRMSVPALVMHDPDDAEVPFEHGRSIAEAWPGARLERLTEIGHRRMLRDAGLIKAATRFIATQDQTGAPQQNERLEA